MFRIKSLSAQDTINFGKVFAKTLKEKDVVLLEGSLGTGKTTFVKGVLKGLGYKNRVLSPSFTLLRQYKLRNLTIYHLDLYRLELKDLSDLGLDDFLYSGQTVTLIEWGGKMREELGKYLRVEFAFSGEETRSLKFLSRGYPKERLSLIKEAYS